MSLRYGDLLNTVGLTFAGGDFLNAPEKVGRIVAIAALVADANDQVLKDDKPASMLECLPPHGLCSNHSRAIFAVVTVPAFHNFGSSIL